MRIRVMILVLAVVASVALFRELIFTTLPAAFLAPDEILSFGWAVPVFSIALLWLKKDEIRASLGVPSVHGMVDTVAFSTLGCFAAHEGCAFAQLLILVGILISVVWALFGRNTAAHCHPIDMR